MTERAGPGRRLYADCRTCGGDGKRRGYGAYRQSCPDCGGRGVVVLDTPAIVCLCGSGRFRAAFEEAEFRETLAGKIVLTIGCNTKDIARDVDWSHVKPMLDALHFRKIDLADEVLILNVGGYVGESTARELEYARSLGKTLRFWEPPVALTEGTDG